VKASSARLLRIGSLAVGALVLFIVPATAHAWGPLAHLQFATDALATLPRTASPVRGLLAEFGHEFLYGSLAADIVVGKNLARWAHHCHNWATGFRVLRAARSDAERAFGWGFLGHLAADTVAHNYFVPWKTVASFPARTRHAYWELRFDQRMDARLSRVARTVSDRRYRRHDALLRAELREGCVLPFTLSRGLFGSLLASARAPRFQAFSRAALARGRRLPLEDELVAETSALAVDAIVALLVEGERSRTVRSDATGRVPLRAAALLRRGLAAHRRRNDAHALALETRASFRGAVNGALVLPRAAARLAA
jgi:hypothetical protein